MGVFSTMQVDAYDELQANPFFSDVPVIVHDEKVITNKISELIERLKICVVIMTPFGGVLKPDNPGPYLDDVRLMVRVYEKPLINRSAGGTGKTALEVVEQVLATLHHNPKDANIYEMFKAANPAFSLTTDDADESTIVYNVFFATSCGLSLSIPAIEAPIITDDAGSITISCATPGAAIFYTTNGSYPNPQSTFYTGAFSISSGVTVRASAWLAGYSTARAQYTKP